MTSDASNHLIGRFLERQNLLQLQEDLRSSSKLFEDPDFPADNSTLPRKLTNGRNIIWKRPTEFCKSAKFFSRGTSRFDVIQGELKDCWLLAALASLCMHQKLLDKVVPTNVEFTDKAYCGMFEFRFWLFGEWRDVWIDDRLPTLDNNLILMRSTDSDEFWSALLEKAYAKTMGSYEALDDGICSEGMVDFTGGIAKFFDLTKEPPPSLFDMLVTVNQTSFLMGCSIKADSSVIEERLENGLVKGHAYSITAIEQVQLLSGGTESLLRLRNPWGDESEWRGSWGDRSSKWQQVSAEEKARLEVSAKDDGEFWMSFADFVENFEDLDVCLLGPDSLYSSDQTDGDGAPGKTRWEVITHNGSWKRNVNAGGCGNNRDTFWLNPQFRIKVDQDAGFVIISLMQKNTRKLGAKPKFISYDLYNLEDGDATRTKDMDFFKYHQIADKSPPYMDTREVTGFHQLNPGTYMIVPSTFEPNQEADFLLRICSMQPLESNQMNDIMDIEERQRRN